MPKPSYTQDDIVEFVKYLSDLRNRNAIPDIGLLGEQWVRVLLDGWWENQHGDEHG